MDIWEADKLIVFIAFVIPGFITLKLYGLLYPSEQKDSTGQLIDAVTYSCINYAILAWPILLLETSGIANSHPGWYSAFYLFALLIAPISLAFGWKFLRNTKLLKRYFHHPFKKPWDYVFSKGEAYWVIVTLNDGRKVGGRYDSDSFASSSPCPEQLYLQEAWEVNEDGGLERPLEGTAGVLVLSPEISAVELIKMTYGEEDVREEANQ